MKTNRCFQLVFVVKYHGYSVWKRGCNYDSYIQTLLAIWASFSATYHTENYVGSLFSQKISLCKTFQYYNLVLTLLPGATRLVEPMVASSTLFACTLGWDFNLFTVLTLSLLIPLQILRLQEDGIFLMFGFVGYSSCDDDRLAAVCK